MHTMSATPASAASVDRVGGERRRHVDHRVLRRRLLDRLGDRIETGTPSNVCPALAGRDAADDFVPYAIICCVWNAPSRPVMPCTSRRVFLSIRMLTTPPPAPSRSPSAPPRPCSSWRREPEVREDLARLSSLVPVSRMTSGTRAAISFERGHDAVRDVVAARDAAEDVEQDRACTSDRR